MAKLQKIFYRRAYIQNQYIIEYRFKIFLSLACQPLGVSLEKTVKLIELVCGDCGESNWHVFLHHEETVDGPKTKLYTMCADPSCVQNKKEETGAAPNELVFWNCFDITGQDYDEDDELPMPVSQEELN